MTTPEGITGTVVEIGDDEQGQPRIIIHTTREAIIARQSNVLFREVVVTLKSEEVE